MTLDLFEVSFLFVGFQSLLFAVILFFGNKSKGVSPYFLGAFLLVLAAQSAVLLLVTNSETYNSLNPYLCVFGFLYGPLLWLYAKSLIYNDFEYKRQFSLHLLPAAIMLLSAVFGLNLCSKFGSLFYLTLITYTILIVISIVGYRRVLLQTQSTNEDIKLSWLQWIVIVFTITFLLDIYEHFLGDLNVYQGLSLVNVLLLILVNSIFFQGLRHPMIFLGISHEDQSITVKDKDVPLEGEVEAELKLISDFMENEKPYLDPKLTLSQLSAQIGIPSRRLSQLVNRHFNKNFIDFINSYRIDLAKERLANPTDKKETVLEVMYDVGFNSKSSFNTIFKEKVGQTPSEYKKSHQ